MDDLATVWKIQPALNPWLVVLLGGISGLLVFAVSNALYVLVRRHRRVDVRPPHPIAFRLRQLVAVSGPIMLVLLLVHSVSGPKLVDGKGWLSGDGLFTVNNRPGFRANYPNTSQTVKQGDVILQLVRDAGPDEVAAATNRRALLLQDREFARLEILRVDPLLVGEQAAATEHLRELGNRKQRLLDSRDTFLRSSPRQQMQDQNQLDGISRDLQSSRHELEQTEASIAAATQELQQMTTEYGPEGQDLLAGDALKDHRKRVELLRSRQTALQQRVELLHREQERLQVLTSKVHETNGAQLELRTGELADIDRQISDASERVAGAQRRIEQDKQRAELQRENRIRQIQLQIDELDVLLEAREGRLDVQAPWTGIVGFRESSPEAVRLGSRPLLILYEPGKVSVKIGVPADQAALEPGDHIAIEMQALIEETSSSTFTGRLAQKKLRGDGSAELLIACDPPGRALRELAAGDSVPVHVIIRGLNPIAAAGVSWGWELAGLGLLGLLFAEVSWRRAARRAAHPSSSDAQPERPSFLQIDWGGDPDEFQESVVGGSGTVLRKLRQPIAVASLPEERRAPPEEKVVKLQTAAHEPSRH